MTKPFAVLISGYGRGCIDIINDYRNNLLKPKLSLVLSSNPNSHALKISKENKISTGIVEFNHFQNKNDFENEILSVLKLHKIEYLFLAGWKYILSENFVINYKNKIVNIHPSLLPSFKGINAIDQAINFGVKITGITTHFVNSKIDDGVIIGQKCINIEEQDRFEEIDSKIYKAGCILTRETINSVFI